MHSSFSSYLDLVTTPERKVIYVAACEALLKLGIDTHEFVLDQLMVMPEYDDTAIFLTQVDNTLIPALGDAIAFFGVTVEETIALEDATDILNALLGIEYYDDPVTLYQHATGEEPPDEALAEILSAVSGRSSDEYLTLINHVSHAFFTRVAELTHAKEVDEPYVSSEETNRAIHRCRAFVATYKVDLFKEAVAEGLRFGASFDLLLESHTEAIEALPIPFAIQNLTAFALASALPDAALSLALHTKLPELWPKPEHATQASVALTHLLEELPYARP